MSVLKNRGPALCARACQLAVAFACVCESANASQSCLPDLDESGEVDFGDVVCTLIEFGPCPTGTACTADLDGSGTVDLGDVVMTLINFGNCPWYLALEQSPNAAVVPSATLRAAITATGMPWRVRDNGTGIEMVLIPAGTFTMGCSASGYSCNSDESPRHDVTLTNAFYMSRTEVTQAQWVATMGSNPSAFTGDTKRPVEQVSWNDIQPFCTATGLRLATEAEWEYAYRAGTTTAFHGVPSSSQGTDDDDQVGNIAWYYFGGERRTHPVATKAANGFGLYDMAGNVLEWCQDRYGSYNSGAQTNPMGPASGSGRVLRGGSWDQESDFCRASYRSFFRAPDARDSRAGFRVVRTP